MYVIIAYSIVDGMKLSEVYGPFDTLSDCSQWTWKHGGRFAHCEYRALNSPERFNNM